MQAKYIHGYAKECMDDFFLFSEFLFFFKWSIPNGMLQPTNSY
jgi:hypothetical protein